MPRNLATMRAILVVILVTVASGAGCAFGDRSVRYDYKPVMSLKAATPRPVVVLPILSGRNLTDERQIGQVRNGYGMITAKVLCADGDASAWVRRALSAELEQTGYSITESPVPPEQGVSVGGTVREFNTDMYVSFTTRLRVQFVVKRGNKTTLDKEFVVDEGGSGLVASAGEYEELTTAALKKLMRRAIPEIVAAIDR